MDTLKQLLHHFVKDMYYAEKRVVKEHKEMANKADSDELRQLLMSHSEETAKDVERLEKVFELLGARPSGTTCEAIDGIIEENHEILSASDTEDVRDVGIAASAQAIEHYEITRYGTLIAWAKRLNMDEAVSLLQETIDEHKTADHKLTELAESSLNRQAA
ncbi:MAG: ferritin-like domain-containing protein [Alphaproteobacteria bacterium]